MMDEPKEKLEDFVQRTLDEEIDQAWLDLIQTKSGRLLVWSILDKCRCFNFDHYGGETDLVHKGRQQIGGEILRDYVFPHGMGIYAQLLVEAEQRDDGLRVAALADLKNEEQEG